METEPGQVESGEPVDEEVKGPDESQFVRAPASDAAGEPPPEDLKGPGPEWTEPKPEEG